MPTVHPNGSKHNLESQLPITYWYQKDVKIWLPIYHDLSGIKICLWYITVQNWYLQHFSKLLHIPGIHLVLYLVCYQRFWEMVHDFELCNLNGIRRSLAPARRYLNCHESAVQTESLPCGSPLLRPVRISSTWSHAEACELPHTILAPAWHRSSICLPPLLCTRHMACISHTSSPASSSWIL